MREENEKIEGRDIRDGGWYWVQQELLYFFVPLIGRDAAWLYQVMCLLIPKSIENPLMELSVRTIAKAGGYGKSVGAVHRGLAVLTSIGMLREEKRGKGKSSIFTLVSLRKLAGVGIDELERRLGVPVGNSDEEGSGETPANEDEHGNAESRADGDDELSDEIDDAASVVGPPAGSQAPSVPVGNTEPNLVENAGSETQVFQKGGGSVPKKGGMCSSGEAPLINLSTLNNSPLPPTQARGGRLRSLAASADVLPSPRKSATGAGAKPTPRTPMSSPPAKRKSIPVEDGDLRAAVALVKRECRWSNPRLDKVIERAMRVFASATDEPPKWVVIGERMVEAHADYLANKHLMKFPIGVRKFLDEGLWADNRRWPWDEKALRDRRRL